MRHPGQTDQVFAAQHDQNLHAGHGQHDEKDENHGLSEQRDGHPLSWRHRVDEARDADMRAVERREGRAVIRQPDQADGATSSYQDSAWPRYRKQKPADHQQCQAAHHTMTILSSTARSPPGVDEIYRNLTRQQGPPPAAPIVARFYFRARATCRSAPYRPARPSKLFVDRLAGLDEGVLVRLVYLHAGILELFEQASSNPAAIL